jgi:hypothetical protein
MYATLEQNEASAAIRESSSGFWAVIERENGSAGARGSCGSQRCVRLTVGFGDSGWFRSGGGLPGSSGRVSGHSRLWLFFNANQALIGNLPAEVAVLAALLKILLEKNGTAGIGHEDAGSGQKNIASAILHFHTSPEKG